MRELSLFSGAGGGLLATKHLLGWETIGYVEFNDYCQRIIRQRIKDGYLDNAPIFGDIRAFIDSGCCELYRGITDVITAGFPCQPFSAAGKQLGADDERNMWPQTIECIRTIRPRYAFLENVPALLSSGYFGTVIGDLAESGYDARWRILSAAELGGPHKRDRVWIVAHANDGGQREQNGNKSSDDKKWDYSPQKQAGNDKQGEPIVNCETSANTKGEQFNGAESKIAIHQKQSQSESGNSNGESIHDSNLHGQRTQKQWAQTLHRQQGLPWGQSLRGIEDLRERPDIPEPLIRRMDDGLANRVDRLKATGNGQVPIVAATTWNLLSEVTK